MIKQDIFYAKKEANAFFERNKKNDPLLFKDINKDTLRINKKIIYNLISKNYKLNKSTKILEVGCFFGDLLSFIKKKHKCEVYGIEPSTKACKLAKTIFSLKIENTTFINSQLFSLKKKNFQKFDVIIFDDVLSWFDRGIILSSFGVIDWILKENGIIFFRDFMPKKNFAHPNHHWKGKEIYNFKYKNGHKNFFLNSGKYKEIFNKRYFSSKLQKINIKNKDSMMWGDTLIKKIHGFTHPIVKV
jgi:cyclopropane fatty-acyl-phospholipid synthase-like methyltransferase